MKNGKVLIAVALLSVGLGARAETTSLGEVESPVLGIKRRVVTSGTQALSVPFLGSDGQSVRLAELIAPECLKTGDRVLAWNGSAYDAWLWDGTKWEACENTRTGLPKSDAFVRGTAVWLERSSGGSILQIGQYSDEAISTRPDAGTARNLKHSLLINPKSEETPTTRIAGSTGDQIVVLTSPKVRLEWNGSAWGTTKNVFNPSTFETVKTFTPYASIPADTGFWYISAGGAPEIKW